MNVKKYILLLLLLMPLSCSQQEIRQPEQSKTEIPVQTTLRVAIINPCKNPDKLSMVKPVQNILRSENNITVKVFHYKEQQSFEYFRPDAVIVTGQSTPWEEYNISNFMYIKEYIAGGRTHYLGICGGHQLLVLLYGGSVDLVKPNSCDKRKGYTGCFKIRGFVTVQLKRQVPLFTGYAHHQHFFASHCEEVKALPKQFNVIASTKISPVYAIKHNSLPLYGVQFHPELPADNNSHSKRVIKNFITISRQQLRTD